MALRDVKSKLKKKTEEAKRLAEQKNPTSYKGVRNVKRDAVHVAQTANKVKGNKQPSKATGTKQQKVTYYSNKAKTAAKNTGATVRKATREATKSSGIKSLQKSTDKAIGKVAPKMSAGLDKKIENTKQRNELMRITRRTQALKDYDRYMDEKYGVKTPWPSYMSRKTPTDDEAKRLRENTEAWKSFDQWQKIAARNGDQKTVQLYEKYKKDLMADNNYINAKYANVTKRDYSFQNKTPLDVLKAEGWTNLWTGKTFPEIAKELRDTLPEAERNKAALNNAVTRIKYKTRNAGARQQALSEYDKGQNDEVRFQLGLAKQDYDRAQRKGDQAGMTAAHQRAEDIRMRYGGYSGGMTGDEYISPDIPDDITKQLNDKGIVEWKKAQVQRNRAVTEDEIARADSRKQQILDDPNLRKYNRVKEALKYDALSIGSSAVGLAETTNAMMNEDFEKDVQKRWGDVNLQTLSARRQNAIAELEDYDRNIQTLGYDPQDRNRVVLQNELLSIEAAIDRKLNPNKYRELASVSPDSLSQRMYKSAQAHRENAVRGLGTVGRYATEAGMMVGEVLPAMALAPLSGGTSLMVMGAQAAGARMNELNARGISPSESFSRGGLAGISAAATEKIPLERLGKLLKGQTGRNIVLSVLGNIGVEIGTEEADEIANTMMDFAYRDPEAEWSWDNIRDTAILTAISAGFMNVPAATVGQIVNGTAVRPRPSVRGEPRRVVSNPTDVDNTTQLQTPEIQAKTEEQANLITQAQDVHTDQRIEEARQLKTDIESYNALAKAGAYSPEEKAQVKAMLDERYAEIAGQEIHRVEQAPPATLEEAAMQTVSPDVFQTSENITMPEARVEAPSPIQYTEREPVQYTAKEPVQRPPVKNAVQEEAKQRTLLNPQTEREVLSRNVKTFGENGQKAIMAAYQPGGDVMAYRQAFADVYDKALSGKDNIAKPSSLTQPQYYAAVQAGFNDRTISMGQTMFTVGRNKNAGIVRDEFTRNLDKDTYRMFDGLGKAAGAKIVFVDASQLDNPAADGQINGNVIMVKKNAVNPIAFVAGHELTHRIQDTGVKEYRAFRDYVISEIAKPGAVDAKIAEYAKHGARLTREKAMDEIAADYAGVLFNGSEELQKFIRDNYANKTLLQTVLDAIRKIAEALTGKERVNADESVRLLEEALGAASKKVKKTKATGDVVKSDKLFSMSSPIEETDTLIALHNINATKMEKALDLGGFPMPSIAVTRKDIPHTNFGDISLIMSRDTIDPKKNKKNTVYSADAWTPTFPTIDYEANDKVTRKISRKYYELYNKYGRDLVGPLYAWVNYPDEELTRKGGEKKAIEEVLDDVGMMKIYLTDKRLNVPEPVQEEKVERLDDATIKFYDHIINALGKDAFSELNWTPGQKIPEVRKAWWAKHGEAFEDAYRDYLKGHGISDDDINRVLEHETIASQTLKAKKILDYISKGPEKRTSTVNIGATNKAIRNAVNMEDYSAWVHDLFDGIAKSSGIYNNKDPFTPSGNRRSFKQTHFPVTLENIAKAMASQNAGNTKNVTGFHGIKSLRAGTAQRFKSIKEMQDLEGRLKHLTPEEAEAINDALSDRLIDIVGRIYDSKSHNKYENQFMETDAIGNILMEVADSQDYSTKNIQKVFKQYAYPNISDALAQDIKELLFDTTQMPVNIFEAKPERAVRFDEVLAAVVPSDLDEELRDRMEDAGMRTIEYEAGNNESRLDAVNSVPEARFSIPSDKDYKGLSKAQMKAQLKRDAGEKLTEAEFNRLYSIHKLDYRGQWAKKGLSIDDQIDAIAENGFKGGSGAINLLPASTYNVTKYKGVQTYNEYKKWEAKGDLPKGTAERYREKLGDKYGQPEFGSVVQREFAPKKGDTLLLVPEGYRENDMVAQGYKPFPYEVLRVTEDYQRPYSLYEKEYQDSRYSIPSDADYIDAVKRGDMEEVQRMVNVAAQKGGFANAVPEQTLAYKVRTTKPPKKTIKVYKVFTVADDGSPTALFVSGVDKLPQNVWLDAQDTWHFTAKNGLQYVPSTQNPYTEGGKTGGQVEIPSEEIRAELIRRGFLPKGSKAKSVTALAYRPGWHAGDLPFFPQGGMEIEGSNYKNVHRYNQVVFECELAADEDYTSFHVQTKGKNKGKVVFHDREEMPENGYYKFSTNPMANASDIGSWYISGSLKILRALTEEECNQILSDSGRPVQEWQQYQDSEELQGMSKDEKYEYAHTFGSLNLEKLGYTGPQYDAARKTLAPITYDDDGNIIPLSERFNPNVEDIRYSLGTEGFDQAQLMRENQQLRDKLAYWKSQTKRSDRTKSDPKAVRRLAKKLAGDYSSGMDTAEIAGSLQAIYDGLGKDWTYDEAYHAARFLARDMVEQASATDDYLYNEYDPMRKFFRENQLVLSPSDRAGITDYNDWRKAQMGRMTIKHGDKSNVDQYYKDLSDLWPEFFREDRESNSVDQLERIAEVLDTIYKREEVNPFGDDIDSPAEYLAAEIMQSFWDLPGVAMTYADRVAEQYDIKAERAKERQRAAVQKEKEKGNARVQREKERGERRLRQEQMRGAFDRDEAALLADWREAKARREERRDRDAALAKMRAAHKEKYENALRAMREDRDARLQVQKEKYLGKEKARSQRQKEREMVARISRHARDLSAKLLRANDKKHLPDGFDAPVAQFLDSINLSSSNHKNTKRTEAFQNLRLAYRDIIENHVADTMTIDPDLMDNIMEVEAMKDIPIQDMSMSQLEVIWRTLRAVEASITTANKAFGQQRFATIFDAADGLRQEMARGKDRGTYRGPLKSMDRLLNSTMLTPESYFHRMGYMGENIFRMLRDAQDKHITIMQEAQEYTREAVGKEKIRKWEKEVHHFKFDGRDVELTTAQIMSLYELMKRQQAIDHITVGGFRPDVVSKGLKEHAPTAPYRLDLDQISEIVNALTDEQMRIADKLQKFMGGRLSELGNEASLAIYGYKKFNEKNYFPIKTDKNQVLTDQVKQAQSATISGRGFTKGTKPHANNALIVGNIFDVFSNHVTDMATYSAWLEAMENLQKIYNFTFRDEDRNVTGTVKQYLEKTFGKNGLEYWEKLTENLNNGVHGTNENPFNAFVGNYKASAIGANIRVFIQQPTAILRAMDQINPVDFIAGIGRGTVFNTWKKVKKYAPIAVWKDWGYFDADTGRQMKSILFGDDGAIGKFNNAMMAPAGFMDSVGWSQIWNALEAETRRTKKHLKPKSEEFYQAVAKRFNEVIDHTQVVDGILQRSQVMRSSDGITKMATSFMSEPTKVYNMFTTAVYDLNHAKDPHVRAAAMKTLGRTTFALCMSFVANAAAQSIVDALRDEDKDETYWEKFFQAFLGYNGDEETTLDKVKSAFMGGNMAQSINPVTYIPWAKDIMSAIQGYSVSRMDMDSITKFVQALSSGWKAANGEGKRSVANALAEIFAQGSRLLGVPVFNMKRDALGIYRTVMNSQQNYRGLYELEKVLYRIDYDKNLSMFMETAYLARKNGDMEAYEAIRADMLENAPTDSEKFDKKISDLEQKDVEATEAYQTELATMSDTYATMLESNTTFNEMPTEAQDKARDTMAKYAQYKVLGDRMELDNDKMEKLDDIEAQDLPVADWVVFKTEFDTLHSIKDENGKTTKSRQEQAIELIDQTFDTKEQKCAAYRSVYDSDANNPWA